MKFIKSKMGQECMKFLISKWKTLINFGLVNLDLLKLFKELNVPWYVFLRLVDHLNRKSVAFMS